MKPYIIVYLFATLLIVPLCGDCQKKHQNCALEQHNLKGNVKYLENRQYIAIVDSGKITKGARIFNDDTYIVHFDNSGNAVRSIHTDYEGNLSNYGEYVLDSMNYRIEEKTYNGKKILVNHTLIENKYDYKGNIIEIVSVSTGEALVNQYQKHKVKYDYDANGNRILSTSFDKQNKLKYKTIYRYNENNLLIEEIHLSAEEKLKARELYRYDKNGNRILWEHYLSDGRLSSSIRHTYDNINNLVDNLMCELRDSILIIGDHFKYVYDSLNNEIEEKTLDAKGVLVRKLISQYTYDAKGNWIECIQYINNNPIYIKERVLEYY